MSFTATFYQTSKRKNSTAIPTGASVTYDIVLKDKCTFSHPEIEVTNNGDAFFGLYNACYIPQFNRYYFITDTEYDRGVWTVRMETDVLASFRSAILASAKYVVRSESDQDVTIVDDFYPTSGNTASCFVAGDNAGWTAYAPSSGCFILGIINDAGSGFGGVTYYIVSYSGMASLMRNVLNVYDLSIEEIGETLAKIIINPAQYLTSCIWLPYVPSSSMVRPLKVGRFNPDGNTSYHATVTEVNTFFSGTANIGGTLHPQCGLNRTHYLNTAPFTQISAHFPGFGNIPIDPSQCRSDTIGWRVICDNITGMAELRLTSDGNSAHGDRGGEFIAVVSSRIGVPIAIGNTSINGGGVVGSVFSTVGGVAALAAGNPVAAAGLIGGGITTAAGNAPVARSSGSQGSFSATGHSSMWSIYKRFTYIAETDGHSNGYVLRKRKTLSSVSGYTVCSTGDIQCAAYSDEHERIRQYLTTGFYIE